VDIDLSVLRLMEREREIPFEELHAQNVIEVAALPSEQVVHDANLVATSDQLFRQVGTDESCAAGDEV